MPHRISAPSKEASGRPRYSLVWKLVFFPKGTGSPGPTAGPARGTTDGSGGTANLTVPGPDGGAAASAAAAVSVGGLPSQLMSAAADGAVAVVGRVGHGGGKARASTSSKPPPVPPTLCRPEWGEPMRLGSARAVPGQPDAWRGCRNM